MIVLYRKCRNIPVRRANIAASSFEMQVRGALARALLITVAVSRASRDGAAADLAGRTVVPRVAHALS